MCVWSRLSVQKEKFSVNDREKVEGYEVPVVRDKVIMSLYRVNKQVQYYE